MYHIAWPSRCQIDPLLAYKIVHLHVAVVCIRNSYIDRSFVLESLVIIGDADWPKHICWGGCYQLQPSLCISSSSLVTAYVGKLQFVQQNGHFQPMTASLNPTCWIPSNFFRMNHARRAIEVLKHIIINCSVSHHCSLVLCPPR